MCSSLLSALEKAMSHDDAKMIASYICGLTPNSSTNITASKVAVALSVEPKKASSLLLSCLTAGVLIANYAIRCPECNMLIRRIPSNEKIPVDEISCYACDNCFFIEPENVEVIYSVSSPDFFTQGQHDGPSQTSPVAPIDSLNSLVASGFNLNKLYYCPSDAEYDELRRMFSTVFAPQKTKKATGDTLETLVAYLFNRVQPFRAAGIKTSTNQIDCFVRNKLAGTTGLLSFIGERIIIECKNEKAPPSGTYLQKLYGIINLCNSGKNTNVVSLGIIVSKALPPKTFTRLSNSYYLRDGIVYLHLSGKDLHELVVSRVNLLDMLERKRDEIVLDATTNLLAANLY